MGERNWTKEEYRGKKDEECEKEVEKKGATEEMSEGRMAKNPKTLILPGRKGRGEFYNLKDR